MATIAEILNKVGCGAGAVLGTGTRGCKPFFKKISAVWLLPKGVAFAPGVSLDLTYVQSLQAQGKLIVLNGVQTFTDNTPDDVTEELESGTILFVRDAKYQFEFAFINGLYFHAALKSLSSYGSYDAIFVDVDGNLLGTNSIDNSIKGFSIGMVQSKKLTWATDSTAQREGFMMQLTTRNELDSYYRFIQRKSLDFEPNLIDGVNDVNLDLVVPSNSDTTITVKATTKQDGNPFTGAVYGQFLVKINGSTSNPSAGDDSAIAGTYVLTVASLATNDVVEVSLYDNANSRNIITVDSALWKSNTATETVIV